MTFFIRKEQTNHYSITEDVIRRAFEDMAMSDKKEHKMVMRIRQSTGFVPDLSLVAMDGETDKIVGHVLLSKVSIRNNKGYTVESLALAPVSVLPEYQNKGIGMQLIIQVLENAKKLSYSSVIVLGHPDFYSKFGFERASNWGIKPPFDVPDEAFMALELQKNALVNIKGTVIYPDSFYN